MGLFSGKDQRYREHQDALAAAQRLVARFRKDGRIDLEGVDLEFRAALLPAVENLICHLDSTLIPAELGNKDMLRELVEYLSLAHRLSTGDVPFDGRRIFRTRTFNAHFQVLREQITHAESESTHWLRGAEIAMIGEHLPYSEQMLNWLWSEPTVSTPVVAEKEALDLIRRAKRLVDEDHQMRHAEEEKKRSTSQLVGDVIGRKSLDRAPERACRACGRENDDDAKFCDGCGEALAQPICPACGTSWKLGAAFCKGCGAKVAQQQGSTTGSTEKKSAPIEHLRDCPSCGSSNRGDAYGCRHCKTVFSHR